VVVEGVGLSDLVIYKCFVCGRAFTKVQSLRAHLKVHRGHNFVRTSIWVDRDDWEKFKEICEKHNTTTCHLLRHLLKAVIKGEELGVVKISAPNPVIINIYNYSGGPPRSRYELPATSFVHEVSLECEVCGAAATALHVKRDWFGYTTVAVCEDHHREAERSFYGDCWIPL